MKNDNDDSTINTKELKETVWFSELALKMIHSPGSSVEILRCSLVVLKTVESLLYIGKLRKRFTPRFHSVDPNTDRLAAGKQST